MRASKRGRRATAKGIEDLVDAGNDDLGNFRHVSEILVIHGNVDTAGFLWSTLGG